MKYYMTQVTQYFLLTFCVLLPLLLLGWLFCSFVLAAYGLGCVQ